MFLHLGRKVGNHPWLVILIAAVLMTASAIYSLDVMRSLTLSPGWEVPGSGSARSADELREHLGRDETPVILLFRPGIGLPRSSGPLVDSPAYREAVEQVLARAATNPDVIRVTSYPMTQDARLRSQDGNLSYAVVYLNRSRNEGVEALLRLRQQIHGDRLEVLLGGELATYVEIRQQLERDIWRAEVASFVVLSFLLVWVFGSVTAAALPLVVSAITIVLSVTMLKLCTLFTDISVYAANVVSMLGLGLSIDYGLFIVSRFREELAKPGADVRDSLARTLATAGRTVTYSGLTVAASLFCLLILPQRFFQNMGLAGGISVAAAMLTSTLILPALLALLGRRVNSLALPVLRRRLHRTDDRGGWYRFSRFVMRHAAVILAGALIMLLAMGQPILHMSIGPADSRSLPATAQSRQVQEILDRHFPHSALSPLVLAVHARGPVQDPASLAGLDELTRGIQALPGVQRVLGLVSVDPRLSLADYETLYRYPEQFPMATETLATYAKGACTQVIVNYDMLPNSPEARELVQRIRDLPLPPGLVSVHVGGFPAFHLDYLHSLATWVPWVILAIVAVICVLLFLMLGSLLIPIKAVLTNLLSLSATFGALVWIFQDGHLAGLLGFTPQGSMDGTILVLIFAAAFGLSVDYEVFLLSRIREVCQATGNTTQAIALGIQKSGPIITSAALLIGIVLGAFATGEVVFMKAMGIGLLLAVIVDATLVRMLLVPSTLRLLGRLNWWMPKPLQRLYRRFHLGERDAYRLDP
ncbi:MAG TPA: MMPL family transporter [Thiobacillaceae bacterium]|nr:MMPL family transporter [Thiobacillaceae bacterium]HNU65292.1 MMPL family transporter [Thiobacillaceae bacterium]